MRRWVRSARQLAVFLLALLPLHAQPAGPAMATLRTVKGFDRTTTTIRVRYADGAAYRTVVDEQSGQVRQRRLPGHPQSSREEFRRAVAIIAGDAGLSPLLGGGAETEGGFIVDGPAGSAPNDRYIQIRLLSPDRRTLLRVVVVDLSTGRIASAKAWFE